MGLEGREMRKAMNYNEFMKAVDEKLSAMSEVEKMNGYIIWPELQM